MTYTPEKELELCRREYNEAGRRLHDAQLEVDAAIEELMQAAERLGAADEAVRHGGYGSGNV